MRLARSRVFVSPDRNTAFWAFSDIRGSQEFSAESPSLSSNLSSSIEPFHEVAQPRLSIHLISTVMATEESLDVAQSRADIFEGQSLLAGGHASKGFALLT